LQHGTQQIDNVFPSWQEFIFALRKQLYPLGYKEKALIEWQSLKLRKGQSVQEYTDEFRKMALMLNIPLHTQETLMKYIGGLPAHIRNTVFMFGPTNLEKVFVQATYIETGKTGVGVSGESSSINFRAVIKFLFNLLDNYRICRITERNTITRYTTFTLGNPHGEENPAKTSLI
jgi:hypothetical protein